MTVSIASALIKVVTNGRNGSGVISVPGVKAGDIVLTAIRNTSPGVGITESDLFNGKVAVDDEIYQEGAGNVSAKEYIIIIFRSDVT